MVINYITLFFPLNAYGFKYPYKGNDEHPYKGIARYPYMGVGAYPCMGKFKQSIYGLPLSCCFNVIHSVIYHCCGLMFVCHNCYSFYFDNS